MPRASSRSSRIAILTCAAASSAAATASGSAPPSPHAAPAEPGPQQAQGQRQRHEALLGAVVEVALEPAALGVGGLEDPRP